MHVGMFLQRAESPVRLNGVEAAHRFFAGCLQETGESREHLWVAHVDDDAHCLHLSQYDGDDACAGLPMSRLVADMIRLGSSGLVLAHNHPSGDPTPSAADRALTRRLAIVSEAMDVALLDHLVIAGNDCRSMRQMGLI